MAKAKTDARGRNPPLDDEVTRMGACLMRQMSLLKKVLKQGKNEQAQECMRTLEEIAQQRKQRRNMRQGVWESYKLHRCSHGPVTWQNEHFPSMPSGGTRYSRTSL
jgi:hypothetical protein